MATSESESRMGGMEEDYGEVISQNRVAPKVFGAVCMGLLLVTVWWGRSQPHESLQNPIDIVGLDVLEKAEEEVSTTTPLPAFSPLLFCWAMVQTTGYEPQLMSAQFYNKAGIFACDDHEVYSIGGAAHVGPVVAKEVHADEDAMGDFKEAGTATSSWLNTVTFMKAWDQVVKDGKWWTNDWTVKVDPDAVFFPDRLRKRMIPHTGGLNAQPAWIGNCDRTWHGSKRRLKIFGSLEIFSRNAIGTYHAFSQKCKDNLPWKGWGEDMFMQNCMEMLEAKAINGTDLLGDKRCYDAPCTDITKVAFHDFKAVEPFFQCWGQSKGSERVHREEQERLRRARLKAAQAAKAAVEAAAEAAKVAEEKARLENEKKRLRAKALVAADSAPIAVGEEEVSVATGSSEVFIRK